MSARQRGMATVEFAVGGAAALMVLFGSIEVSRMLYVWNTVAEGTRRAAHIAAICPMNDPRIAEAAMFGGGGDDDGVKALHGLTAEMVQVDYLDSAGAPTAAVTSVAYITVSVAGYQHRLMIPFLAQTVAVPAFASTVPRESLGWVPELGVSVCLET